MCFQIDLDSVGDSESTMWGVEVKIPHISRSPSYRHGNSTDSECSLLLATVRSFSQALTSTTFRISKVKDRSLLRIEINGRSAVALVGLPID